MIEWIQAYPSIFNKVDANYKKHKEAGPVVFRLSLSAWRGVDQTGPKQMVSWAAYGVYKVDQATHQ